MTTATFTFNKLPGSATRDLSGTFVVWGGAYFQLEAAKPELRAAIEAALAEASQGAQQRNRRAYMGGMSRNARKASY